MAVLKKKGDFLTDLVVRVVRLSSVTAGAVASGLTCLSRLLTGRGRVNWSDVSQLYGVVLAFMTDSRPKVHFLISLPANDLIEFYLFLFLFLFLISVVFLI